VVAATGALLAGCGQQAAPADQTTSRPASADAGGPAKIAELVVPANYRTSYQGLGTWAVAADPGVGSKELHIVYASPGAAAAWRRDHRFPDGTVLVKEVYEAATAPMTTGTVSHAATLKGRFVMVRAAGNPHPDDKRWGDGWSWAWFDGAETQRTKTVDYKAECLTCHEPARKTDFSYVEGYPALASP